MRTTDGEWYMPTTLEDLIGLLNQLPKGTNYKLVAGNITGFGMIFLLARTFCQFRNNP
jgi:hypothetical protein